MIIHSNLSKMKSIILPACLQGNYRNSLGEFRNTSCGVFATERVKLELFSDCQHLTWLLSATLTDFQVHFNIHPQLN